MRAYYRCKGLAVCLLNIIGFTGVYILFQISTYDVLEKELILAQSQQDGIVYPSRKDLIKKMARNEYTTVTGPLFNYIHVPPNCKFHINGERNVLILVKSAVKHFGLRNAIRQTWGGAAKQWNMTLYFLLALNTTDAQARVEKEFNMFNDLVQQDFQDAYLNNTFKTIMSYHFAEKYCHSANLVLFIDDDSYLDIDRFRAYVLSLDLKIRPDIFEGFLIRADVIRDVKSKWFVSYEEYPFTKWPLYLAGGAYVATMSVIKKFNRTFPKLHQSGIDDAWLGIVAKIAKVIPSDNYLFHNAEHFTYLAFLKTDLHDPQEIINKWKYRNTTRLMY